MHKQGIKAWKHSLVFILLILCIGGLAVRHYLLVRKDGQMLGELARRQQQMTIIDPGRPGGIFIASGRSCTPIAISRQAPLCFVYPSLAPADQLDEICRKLGGILGKEAHELRGAITRRPNSRFVVLAKQISGEQAKAVKALNLQCVGVVHEWRREYPANELCATVVGFPPAPGVANTGAGIELTYKDLLAAKDGMMLSLTDAIRRPVEPLDDRRVLPEDGSNIVLYIDAPVQEALEKALAAAVEKHQAQWANGIVVDPKTGAIVAMASAPSFNPADYSSATPANRTNRAITVPYEPGSVAKPIFAAAAVEAGIVTYETKIFCENGTYVMPRAGRVSDHGEAHGWLTVRDGIVFSSNICMAKIGQMTGNERLYEIATSFGLGRKSGIDLPGEDAGIVRDLHKWNTYSTPRVPFGQEVSTTSLQLVMAFSALVNGGELLQPRVVNRVLDSQQRVVWQSERTVVRRVISEGVSAQTRSVLADVVERGTGKMARMNRWTSFGKTGTAQVPGPRGYEPGAYTGSFIGGSPVGEPRVVCLISVFKPKRAGYYGSTVAAPYVKDVLEQAMVYYNVPPDRPEGQERRR